jgi:hypothetical protein
MPTTGASVCLSCPAFATTATAGATSIAACKCGKGYFSSTDTSGAIICSACPEGSTTATAGASSVGRCTCQAGNFLDTNAATGASSCVQCKDILPFSTSLVVGAMSMEVCQCLVGYFMERNETTKTCRACDTTLMNCSIPGITLANMPIRAGGWRLGENTSTITRCFNKGACVGAADLAAVGAVSRRRLGIATAGDALCAPGHQGFLCGVCVAGWSGYSDTSVCSSCAGSVALAFLPMIFMLLFFLIVAWRFCRGQSTGISLEAVLDGAGGESVQGAVKGAVVQKKQEMKAKVMAKAEALVTVTAAEDTSASSARRKVMQKTASTVLKTRERGNIIAAKVGPKLKILLSLYQILQGIGEVFSIPFPTFFEQWTSSVAGFIQLDLGEVMPLDCIFRRTFYDKLILKSLWPLAAYGLCYLASIIFQRRKMDVQASFCIDLSFFFMFVVYPSLSTSLLSMFYCYPMEDGTSWLRVDLSLMCHDANGTTTGQYFAMIIFTIIMLGVHTVGTPAVYAYLFFRKYREPLEALKQQELNDAWQKNLEDQGILIAADQRDRERIDPEEVLPGYMRRLTGGYERRTYWFELFECIRKVLLVGVPSTFPERGGTAQLFWGLIVCFGTFGACNVGMESNSDPLLPL